MKSEYEFREYLTKFILFLFFSAIILAPIIIWRISLLGNYFYLDEYTWYHSDSIARTYVSNLDPFLNPLFSLEVLIVYFENIAYPFYPILILPLLFLIFIDRKENSKKVPLLLFLILFLVFLIIPTISLNVRLFDRYAYPGFFAFVITLSVSLFYLYEMLNTKTIRSLFLSILLILLVVNVISFFGLIFRSFDSKIEDQKLYFQDVTEASKLVENGGGNVLFRSYFIEPFLPENVRLYNLFALEKNDAINYLLWTDETEVTNSLKKYDIKWIFIYNNDIHLEEEYYGWTAEEFGKTPGYLDGLSNSKNFEKVYSGNRIDVYRTVDFH